MTSDACTNEPSGEDLYTRHVARYFLQAGIDLKSLELDGGNDLMVFDDSLDGFEHAVIYGSCSFSSVTDVPCFVVSKHSVVHVFSTLIRHLHIPGGNVRGQRPRFCMLLTVTALAQNHSDGRCGCTAARLRVTYNARCYTPSI